MRNKIIALLVALVFVLTGCSGVQADYWNKMKEVSKWEGTETAQTGTALIQFGPEQLKIDFKTTATMNQKTMSGYMKMEMAMEMPQSLMAPAPVSEDGMPVEVDEVIKPEPITFDMEIYIDKGKAYISKSYFEQIFTMSGMPLPEAFTKLDADYIGIKESNELTAMLLEMMGDKANIDELLKVYEDMGKLLGVDIAVVKEGNTYTISLGKEEIVALIKSVMNNVVSNIEKINEQFALGLTTEEIAVLKEEYTTQKAMYEEQIDQMAMLVDGELSWASTFEKDKLIDKLTMKVGPSVEFTEFAEATFGGPVGMEMTLDQTSTKVAPKEVKIQGKTVELSEAELNQLMGIETPAVIEEEKVPTPAPTEN